MPSCQLCGRDTDSLTKVKIEGAKLKVCETCEDMGEKVTTSKRKKKRTGSKNTPRSRKDRTLAKDYGKRIKQAREDEEISIKELADELNEKSSLISKLEKQDLKPDNTLASKLSERLDIDLYTNPEVNDYDTGSGDDRSATVKDVAEVKD